MGRGMGHRDGSGNKNESMVDRYDQNKLHKCIHISKNKQYSLKVLSLVMNTLRDMCVYTNTQTHTE